MVRLVADIGGTNARFALVQGGEIQQLRVLSADDFPLFHDALDDYLKGLPSSLPRPQMACLAVAAPLLGDQICLTNRGWSFSKRGLQRQFHFQQLEVINDFHALVMALPFLTSADVQLLGGPSPGQDHGAKLVLGPGTGLGVASLVPHGSSWVPLPGEGGHASFAPGSKLECELLSVLRARWGRVSYETILSGPGLANLWQALLDLGQPGQPRSAAQITAAAQAGESAARDCLATFAGILGSYAGDLALICGARGGVYIGGGIAPRILPFLQASSFRQRFEEKAPMERFVHGIPTYVITAGTPALTGAAAWLALVLEGE